MYIYKATMPFHDCSLHCLCLTEEGHNIKNTCAIYATSVKQIHLRSLLNTLRTPTSKRKWLYRSNKLQCCFTVSMSKDLEMQEAHVTAYYCEYGEGISSVVLIHLCWGMKQKH